MAAPVASAMVVEAQLDEVPPMDPEAMVAVLEAAVHSTPPAAPEATPVLGRTEGVAGEGPSDTIVVAEETNRELSLSLTSGGSCPPMQDEHPLW